MFNVTRSEDMFNVHVRGYVQFGIPFRHPNEVIN